MSTYYSVESLSNGTVRLQYTSKTDDTTNWAYCMRSVKQQGFQILSYRLSTNGSFTILDVYAKRDTSTWYDKLLDWVAKKFL